MSMDLLQLAHTLMQREAVYSRRRELPLLPLPDEDEDVGVEFTLYRHFNKNGVLSFRNQIRVTT